MGKLLALELCNFKSYKGQHTLQFGDSYFTSIIGPNGSGKSNSMDAISFVLGIKSSHLRSTHLKDLIYRGRVLKHSKIDVNGDATEDGVDGATNGVRGLEVSGGAEEDEEAETQTSTQRTDAQSAWVVAVYEDDAGEEQRWKRTITSTGSSEYRINNRTVSAKVYNESLEAENILIKARNFLVFQGDVEAVASQTPKDLTRLLEQISGSLEHKAEYERLKAEHEKATNLQTQKLQARRGINGEIRQYQQQKDELDRYEQKRDEKDKAVVANVLWKLYHFQRTIEDSTAEIQKHQDELQEFRRNVRKFEDKLDGAKKEQAKIGRDVSKIEREVKRKEKAVDEKENALVPIDEKLSISKANLASYQKHMQEVGKERDAQRQAAQTFEKNLAKVQKAQKRWDDEWRAQQQQAGRELSDADLQECQRLRGEVYKRSGSDQIKVDNITRQLRTDEETVNSLRSKVESTRAHVESLEEEIAGLQQRRADVNKVVKTTNKEVEAKKVVLNSLDSERRRTRQKATELNEKILEAGKKLLEAQGQQRESAKEAQQRETVAQMKRIFPGVRGMVHQLCKPKQKKYETAVATALGKFWDAVVVDTEKTARDCIQYLKEQHVGHTTFLPLDTIIHTQPNANLRGMHRGMRLAIDTIEFDTVVERAMSTACGNAIVTDDLDIARELCYRRNVDAKAVTLDGSVIHKGGNMTGGEIKNDKKRHFDDAEVENLRTLVHKFKADLDGLPNDHKRQLEEETLQSELSGLQQKLKYAQDELAALDRNLDSKDRELQFVQGQLSEAQPKYEEQSAGLETLRQSLEQYTTSIAEIEDEVFAAFCQRLGYTDIRQYERQQGSMQQEAREKENEFKNQVSRLQNQLVYEEQRVKGTEARLKNIQTSGQRDEALVAQLETQREELGNELDVLNAEIEQLNEKLAELKETEAEQIAKVNAARDEVRKRSKSVDKTLKEVTALEAEVQKASTSRYTVLRTCKLENIDLPLERGSRNLASLPLEDAILEENGDEDTMDIDSGAPRPLRINDYGIHPKFTTLADDLKSDDSSECEAQLANAIHDIEKELDRMAPNMRSADRLEATSEKLRGIETDFKEASSGLKKATRAFEAVQRQRMELFNKAFSHIKDQIGPVYKDLTKSASWPLGGQAYLDVEDEDEPYLSGVKYHATPPGKRFRDMEHLSGGEKTMAALALLFAIHTYAPSPFFVLDEVDAALDVANTSKLANYVTEHAGPGMQFVVISLKTGLFQNSETLVGVMRDQAVNSSKAVTLDLRKYQAV